MKMNEQLQAAVQALRNSAAKGNTKKAVLENIENISSATVLLVCVLWLVVHSQRSMALED